MLLSSSDDMTIRLWDWEKNWVNAMTFEGHTHYVMMVAFNPKDTNTFASASLDRSIKVRALLGRVLGAGALLLSAAGVMAALWLLRLLAPLAQVWGLNTPQPHFTLEGHEKGVNCVEYFAGGDRPYLVSGADDQTVKVRHTETP
jgi:coatomer subunit beta'